MIKKRTEHAINFVLMAVVLSTFALGCYFWGIAITLICSLSFEFIWTLFLMICDKKEKILYSCIQTLKENDNGQWIKCEPDKYYIHVNINGKTIKEEIKRHGTNRATNTKTKTC